MDWISIITGLLVGVILMWIMTRRKNPQSAPKDAARSSVILSSRAETKINSDLPPSASHRFSEEVDQAINNLLATALVDRKIALQQGWEHFNTKKNVEMWKRSVPNSTVPEIKGAGIVNAPVKWVVDLVTAMDKRKAIDPLFKKGEAIEQLSKCDEIVRLEFQKVWPTSGRDFVAVMAKRFLHDGTAVVAYKSVEIPAAPPVSGVVRGTIIHSGYVIQPVSATQSRVVYTALVELNGSIPGMIIRRVASEQPLLVAQVALLSSQADFSSYIEADLDQKDQLQRKLARSALENEESETSPPPLAQSTKSSSFKVEKSKLTPKVIDKLVSMSDETVDSVFQSIADMKGWQYMNTTNEVQIFRKKLNNSPIHCFMGKGLIRAPPERIDATIRSVKFRHMYDSMLQDIQVIRHVCDFDEGGELKIVHMYHTTRQCLIKTERDLCLMQRSQRIEERATAPSKNDNTDDKGYSLVTCARSIDWHECPETSVTRAYLHASGWVIEPHPEDENSSIVSYLVQMDPGGAIPTRVINLVAKKQPLCIHYIRKYLEE